MLAIGVTPMPPAIRRAGLEVDRKAKSSMGDEADKVSPTDSDACGASLLLRRPRVSRRSDSSLERSPRPHLRGDQRVGRSVPIGHDHSSVRTGIKGRRAVPSSRRRVERDWTSSVSWTVSDTDNASIRISPSSRHRHEDHTRVFTKYETSYNCLSRGSWKFVRHDVGASGAWGSCRCSRLCHDDERQSRR